MEQMKMKIAQWLADPENSEHDLFNFLMDDCGIGEYYDECVAQQDEDDTPCNPPCEKRSMLGRSWWKNQGYNSPCGCAVKAHNEQYPNEKIKKRSKRNSVLTKIMKKYKK